MNETTIKTNTPSISFIKETVNSIINSYFKNKIDSVSLFGSYACGTQTDESDIDLLIDVKDFGMSDLGQLILLLESALDKKVDLTFLGNNNPYFMKVVNKEKITLYEK